MNKERLFWIILVITISILSGCDSGNYRRQKAFIEFLNKCEGDVEVTVMFSNWNHSIEGKCRIKNSSKLTKEQPND